MSKSYRETSTKQIATDAGSEERDPSQLILPHVDTGIEWWKGLTWDEIVLFIPVVIAGLATAYAILAGAFIPTVLFGFVTAVMLAVATWMHITTDWYSKPHRRLLDWLEYRRLRLSLPWGHVEAVERTHGIERVAADGSIITRDGRRVALVAVEGTNADRLDPGEEARLVKQLTGAIDEDIRDFQWAYYSTSLRSSMDELADHRETRAREANRHGLSTLQQDVLYDSAEWLREDDARWDANEWHQYIEVTVWEGEADYVTAEDLIRRLIPGVSTSPETAPDTPETTAAELLTERVAAVEDALMGVEDIKGERATAEELVKIGLRYWTGAENEPSQDLIEAFEQRRDAGGYTPAETMFAPGHFDARGTTIEIGEEYARTFWVAEWPTSPDELFLQDVFTADGADVDIKIYATPRDSREVRQLLEPKIAGIDAEGMKRVENTDVSALTIDDDLDAYVLAYSLLQHTSAQPWNLNAYVTVRAASKSELDDKCGDIKRVLQSTPANAWPIASGTRQKAAFASAAPFARDVLAEELDRDHLCLGGALGAMFPFGAPRIIEAGGVRHGRNTLTGEPVIADPFDRGTSPHMITVGKSRSGKTYGVTTGCAEWYHDRDDRTLIVCDTQGGFEGLTRLCDGKHIVIDGSQGVNPLDIRPMAEHERASTGGAYNSYRLKIDEATEFFAGVIRAQGIDPSDYRSTIEKALDETYERAGILPDPETHGNESPTVSDFIETLSDMMENAEEYTFTSHEREIEVTRTRIADLLNRLSSFRDGKYSHLLGQTETGLTPEVRMAYLDLRQLQGQSDADQSVMLHLVLSQVAQLIKQTPGETMFVIDEAHQLLHSEEMVEWLQQAAREWARFESCIHLVSQSPQEFVRRAKGVSAGQENNRETLVEQSAVVQVFNCPRTSPETLRQLGLHDELIRVAKDKLTPGHAGKGYSECLVQFSDQRGWVENWVEAPPMLDRVIRYTSREMGESFEEFVRDGSAVVADGGSE